MQINRPIAFVLLAIAIGIFVGIVLLVVRAFL